MEGCSGAGKVPYLIISKLCFFYWYFQAKMQSKDNHSITKHHSNSGGWIFNRISVLQFSYYTEQCWLILHTQVYHDLQKYNNHKKR